MQLDLRSVPFFYLNGRADRRQHIEAILRGFIHERVDGTPSPLLGDRKDLRLLAPLGHARLIEHAVRRMGKTFEPFVLLEDDVDWRGGMPPDGPLTVAFPDYSDAVYLGISACGALADRNDSCYHVLRNRTPGFPHLQRIYNMLSAHAVLFLSFRHTMAYAQAMIESCATGEPCDTLSCRLFAKHEVFALGEPLMYQKAALGGQEAPTNITWTDGGNSDPYNGRACARVYPFSTGLEPIGPGMTIAYVVATDAELACVDIQPNTVVFVPNRRLYQRARDRVPDAVVLLNTGGVVQLCIGATGAPENLLRALVRINPHNTYFFTLATDAIDTRAGITSRTGVWTAWADGERRIVAQGGDLDSLLAYTDPGQGAPSVRSMTVLRTDVGYVL